MLPTVATESSACAPQGSADVTIPPLFDVRGWREHAADMSRGVGKLKTAPCVYSPPSGEERHTLLASPPRPKGCLIDPGLQKSCRVQDLERSAQEVQCVKEAVWAARQERAREDDAAIQRRRKEFQYEKQQRKAEEGAHLRAVKRAAKELSTACWQRNEENRMHAQEKMISDERRNAARRRAQQEEFQQRMTEGNKQELMHSKGYRQRLNRKVKDHVLNVQLEKIDRRNYLSQCYETQKTRLDARHTQEMESYSHSREREVEKRSAIHADREGGQCEANTFSNFSTVRSTIIVDEKRERRAVEEKSLRVLRKKFDEFASTLRMFEELNRREMSFVEASETRARKKILKDEKAVAAYAFPSMKRVCELMWMAARALDNAKAKQIRLFHEHSCQAMRAELGRRRAAERQDGRDRRNQQQADLMATRLSEGLAIQMEAQQLARETEQNREKWLAGFAEKRHGKTPERT